MRLRDLDPQATGMLAAELVTAHMQRLAPTASVDNPYSVFVLSQTRWLTRILTEYAQRGPSNSVPSHHHAMIGLRDLCDLLWSSPMARGGLLDAPLDGPLGLVAVAALCRIKLADGEPVSLQELSALSSRSVHAVQSAMQRGRLPVTGRGRGVRAQIAARDALDWLDALAARVGAEQGIRLNPRS